MTEGIENIISQPKQTEFTVTLPDREEQWTKCPAYVTKTKTEVQSTTETIDGVDVTTVSDPVEVPYTEIAMQDSGETDQEGNILMTPIKLSEVPEKVQSAVEVLSSTKNTNDKMASSRTIIEPSPAQLKQQATIDALVATFADDKGIVNEQALKEKATWGLGCPANCGGYREFVYSEMIPQTYVCPVCGVTINLV